MSRRISQPALSADDAAAELCRRHLSDFVREFWGVIIAEDLEWNWHMEVLCDELEKVYRRVFLRYKRLPNGSYELDDEGKRIPLGRLEKEYDLIINIPPGTSKSTIVTVMAPVWGWVVDGTLRHITGSYSGGLAMELAEKSRDIITSDKFKLYFPEIRLKSDRNSLSNYKNTTNGQRLSTSVGGTITGMHAHIITIDDPLNPKQASSKAELATANKWFDTTLSSRKVNKKVTPTILVMQRLATNDPTGHLLAKQGKNIRHICLPAEVSKAVKPSELKSRYIGGLLDPNRMPKKVLDEARIDLGSAGYAGQYDQLPVPEGGLIWNKWFIEVPDEAFPPKTMMQQYGTDWDLAYTDDDENSACAYVSGGKIGQKIYIDDIGWEWKQFPRLITWMKSKPFPHYIEAKASGKSAKSTLTALGIPAIEVNVKGGDKVARANMATPTAEAGICYIRKSLADRLYNDSKQGILFFPKGSHSDLNDALTQFLQRLGKANTYSVSAGDHLGSDGEDDPFDWDD